MTIQEILKEYKRKTGYTLEYMASLLGTTRFTLSRIISGETKKVSEELVSNIS